MKLFLVRHGETDWQQIDERGVRGWARSFAPLSPVGRLQIDAIASDYRLQEAEAILCSSYARALESGARLSRVLNKPLYVEYDLHEWLPHKDSLGDMDENVVAQARRELSYYTGFFPFPERRARNNPNRAPGSVDRRVPLQQRRPPPSAERNWETLDEVKMRVVNVLKRYRQLSTVVLVSHAVVMTSLIGVQRQIDHAEIVPYDLDLDAPQVRAPREDKVKK